MPVGIWFTEKKFGFSKPESVTAFSISVAWVG